MANGSFTPMTKPNFTNMNRKELKAYIRAHPTDSDAIRELFVNRRSKDAKTYPFPYDMSKQELEEIFRKKQELE
jgi:hypothetical protein